jgi:hypothetical protein
MAGPHEFPHLEKSGSPPARGRHHGWITLAAAITLIVSPAFAADLDLTPPPAPSKNAPVRTDLPNCNRWTDECITCTRETPGAAPVCSNIGIACQPRENRCLGDDIPQAEPGK